MSPYYYVIDLRVVDYEGAAKAFRKVFGIEGHVMWSEYEPSGTTRGIHFKTGGLAAFGILSPADPPKGPTATRLMEEWKECGDGITLLGATAIDATGALCLTTRQKELEDQGIRFDLKEPMRVGDETLNRTKKIFGVTFLLAQHDEGHWERWAAGEHVSDLPPPTDGTKISRRIDAAYAVEIVVPNLNEAIPELGKILGTPKIVAAGDLSAGLDGAEFVVSGLHAVRVVAPNGQGEDERSRLAQSYLAAKGPGVYLLEMMTSNVAKNCAAIADSGIPFAEQHYTSPRGTHALTEMLYGLALEYTQPNT